MPSRRDLLLGISAGAAHWALSSTASASSAYALSLKDLVTRSQHALVATPTHSEARWEFVGDARRIVTYTQLSSLQSVDGRALTKQELAVRTLGGTVGNIQQIVHGEARMTLSKPNLVFIDQDDAGIWRVTGMAQGHYPIKPDLKGVSRLNPSPDVPALLRLQDAAIALLPGLTVSEAETLVARQLATP
jgi:hypothetical protein